MLRNVTHRVISAFWPVLAQLLPKRYTYSGLASSVLAKKQTLPPKAYAYSGFGDSASPKIAQMPTYIVAQCYCRRGGPNFYDSGGQISSQTLRTKGFLRFETPDKLPNATHIVISVILEAILEHQKAPKAYVYSGFGDFRSSRVSQTLRTE